MLSKCANPDCSEHFLYFRRGKLFRWDGQATNLASSQFGEDPAVRKPPRRVEFFWLCEDCASRMTLTFDKGSGIAVKPIARAQTATL
jgi:hypothetical protein